MERMQDGIPPELARLLDEGRRLAERGEHDRAIDALRRVADQLPEEATARYNYAVACLAKLKGDLEHHQLWEDLVDDEGLLETAILECEAALELQPDMLPAINNLGILYALRGWYDKACEQWERSLRLDPDQPRVLEDMALAREKLKA